MIERIIEYADSTLALFIALVFAVLGPLGIVSQAAIDGSILGTLAILALMMLRDRANNSALRQKITNDLGEVTAEVWDRDCQAYLGPPDGGLPLRGQRQSTLRVKRWVAVPTPLLAVRVMT
jgi:hypothetical protein